MSEKTYIGEQLFASFDGSNVVITFNDLSLGIERNILLTHEVLENLAKFISLNLFANVHKGDNGIN